MAAMPSPHGLPRTTTYSYVAAGYPWFNHEILAEYALALGADHLGGPGMLVVKCLLGLAVVGMIFRRALGQGVSLIAACATTLLVAICLGCHWSLRPQLFSYVGFALLLGILSAAFAGWEGRWQLPMSWLRRLRGQEPDVEPSLEYSVNRLKLLWLVPLLMMVWTNAHGGFLAGLCVLFAYLGLRGIEVAGSEGRAADGLIVRFALMAAVAVLATFINPYSFQFHLWLFGDLSVPRPEIVEWRPPVLSDPQNYPFIAIVVCWLACLAASRKSKDFTQQVILALVLWQACAHVRHIAFLAIAFGWWMPIHVNSVLQRLGIGVKNTDEPAIENTFSGSLSPVMQRVFAGLLLMAIAICGGQLAMRLGTLKVERDKFPVAAFDYIARHKLSGKAVVTFNWAQYALAAFGPRTPDEPGLLVQIDGRCRTSYSQEMLDMHFDFILGDVGPDQRYRGPASGPFDPLRSLNFQRPDLVLIARGQEPSVEVMNRQRDRWVLLYQDELAQLWGRTARYGDPQSAVLHSTGPTCDRQRAAARLCPLAGAAAVPTFHCPRTGEHPMTTEPLDTLSLLTSEAAGASALAQADSDALARVDYSLDQLQHLADILAVEDRYEPTYRDYVLPRGFKLSIVIPVFNEKATIERLISHVVAVPVPKEIIIVDDASTDGTREVLKQYDCAKGVHIICKPRNEGKGAALRTGFRRVTGDVVVVQDADLEYDPRDIVALIKPLVLGQADVVYGSRFLGDRPQDKSFVHRLGNRLLTAASNLTTGLSLTDMETCYKAFRREVLQSLELRQDRFGFEPEVTAKIARKHVRVAEVPIHYVARSFAEGKKIGVKDLFNALYCIVRYGLAD